MNPEDEFERFVVSRGGEFYVDRITMNYRVQYKGHNFAIDRLSMLMSGRTGDFSEYFAHIADQFDIIDEAEYRERFTLNAITIDDPYVSSIPGRAVAPDNPIPVPPKKKPAKPTRDFVVKKKFNFDIDDCEI